MTKLWRVDGQSLVRLPSEILDSEASLEDWLEADISILDPNLIIIGRQVDIRAVGRLDLLALDSDGVVTVIELKRHKTPRDIVAQVLDYASWGSAPPGPGLEARPRDTERPTHPRRRPDPPMLRDEGEPHSWSFAKQAAAYFRMSRSAFSRTISRFSRTISASSGFGCPWPGTPAPSRAGR